MRLTRAVLILALLIPGVAASAFAQGTRTVVQQGKVRFSDTHKDSGFVFAEKSDSLSRRVLYIEGLDDAQQYYMLFPFPRNCLTPNIVHWVDSLVTGDTVRYSGPSPCPKLKHKKR